MVVMEFEKQFRQETDPRKQLKMLSNCQHEGRDFYKLGLDIIVENCSNKKVVLQILNYFSKQEIHDDLVRTKVNELLDKMEFGEVVLESSRALKCILPIIQFTIDTDRLIRIFHHYVTDLEVVKSMLRLFLQFHDSRIRTDCLRLLGEAMDKELRTCCVLVLIKDSNIREVLESYHLDGLELDSLCLATFARGSLKLESTLAVETLIRVSKLNLHDREVQNVCMNGLDEYCRIEDDINSSKNVELIVNYVLDYWTVKAHKGRLMLEQLLLTALKNRMKTSDPLVLQIQSRLISKFKENIRGSIPALLLLMPTGNLSPEFFDELLDCFATEKLVAKMVLEMASVFPDLQNKLVDRLSAENVAVIPAIIKSNQFILLENHERNTDIVNLMIWNEYRKQGMDVLFGPVFKWNDKTITIPNMERYLKSNTCWMHALPLLMFPRKTSVKMTSEHISLCKMVIPLLTKVNSHKCLVDECIRRLLVWCDDEFLEWFQAKLMECCIYPNAPAEKCGSALEWLCWCHKIVVNNPDTTFALITMVCSSGYDVIRKQACTLLNSLPAPLPGIETYEDLDRVLQWIILFKRSTDTGSAYLLQVIRQKYVVELGWMVDLFPESEGLRREIQDLVDVATMNMACDLANKCERAPKAYCVGAVYTDGRHNILSVGYSRELPGNTHAEECAFMKAKLGEKSTMYTSMEPCSVRLSGNRDCASRCIEANVLRVVCGVKEPSKFVVCQGTQTLRDHGIIVDYITDKNTINRCMAPNMFLFSEDKQVEILPDYNYEKVAQFQDIDRSLADRHLILQLVEKMEIKLLRYVWSSNCDRRIISMLLESIFSIDLSSELMDCRGLMGDNDFTWSFVGDACLLLDTVVFKSDLSFEQLHAIGHWVLKVLCSVKHQGGIGIAINAFQGICTSLLETGIPGAWLDEIIEQFEDAGDLLLLRRSIGFGGAFLAIARACKRKTNPLLEKMMQFLLCMTSNRTVLSLNILKVLMEDSSLQNCTAPYFERILIIAVQGFESDHWQVRNSSMMVFGKILLRMPRRGTLVRYPELKRCLIHDLSQKNNLYPWLTILVRLEEPHGDLVSLVMQCRNHRVGWVRLMAARALTAIVPATALAETWTKLVNCQTSSANECHGTLLQILHLLQNKLVMVQDIPLLESALDVFSSCTLISDTICEILAFFEQHSLFSRLLSINTPRAVHLACTRDPRLLNSFLSNETYRIAALKAIVLGCHDENTGNLLVQLPYANYPPELKLQLSALRTLNLPVSPSVFESIKSPDIQALAIVTNLHLRQASAAKQVTSLRFAAAECLASIDCFDSLLALVQDENDTVRELAVQLANRYLQCDLVEPLVLEKLVCLKPIPSKKAQVSKLQMQHPLDLGKNSEPVFDVEPDNLYIEPILFCRLDADELFFSQLEILNKQTLWPGGVAFNPKLFHQIMGVVRYDSNSISRLQAIFQNDPLPPMLRALMY